MFEQLYQEEWLESKGRMAFLLGMSYSVMGIFSAMVLFPDDPGLTSVAFTSMLILPSLHNLLALEANQMAGEARFSIARLIWDHWDILTIYLYMFLGSMLTFGFFAAMWPPVATSAIFAQQASIATSLGYATASQARMMDLLTNNMRVLFICLLTSFFYGAGSIFILIWNASAWGVIFGIAARASAGTTNPFIQFLYTILLVSPHLIIEAGSYFFAATAGGVVSKGVIREKFLSARFNRVMQDGVYLFLFAVIFVVLGAYIEAYFTPWLLAYFR